MVHCGEICSEPLQNPDMNVSGYLLEKIAFIKNFAWKYIMQKSEE